MLIARDGSPRLATDFSEPNHSPPQSDARNREISISSTQKYIGLWDDSEAIDANYGVDVRSAH